MQKSGELNAFTSPLTADVLGSSGLTTCDVGPTSYHALMLCDTLIAALLCV